MIITIVGGIITSLFIPIVLLLVRSYIQRRDINSSDKTSSDKEDEDERITIANGLFMFYNYYNISYYF